MLLIHVDTHGIGHAASLSIPFVSDLQQADLYHRWMAKKAPVTTPPKAGPPPWAARFKTALRAKGLNLAKIAERMELQESTLRHWTNGTRDINLADFFAMCRKADIDPEIVLFGDQPTKEGVSKSVLQLAAKIDRIKDTKNGQAALTIIESMAAVPTEDKRVEQAFKTNERPKIRGVISRPTLFNDDLTGPRDG